MGHQNVDQYLKVVHQPPLGSEVAGHGGHTLQAASLPRYPLKHKHTCNPKRQVHVGPPTCSWSGHISEPLLDAGVHRLNEAK